MIANNNHFQRNLENKLQRKANKNANDTHQRMHEQKLEQLLEQPTSTNNGKPRMPQKTNTKPLQKGGKTRKHRRSIKRRNRKH